MANTDNKTKFIMIQGTMSNAGKSLVVAGLCRIFKQDGYRVAPFKSQNMALNSFITENGLEMGRAQVMQAEAAGIKPTVFMNPILLKPTNDVGSQVIVNGKVRGNMKARDYFAYKKELIPDIESAIEELKKDYEIIVIEGAGSPAEINLKENDIVNMGMAKLVDAPVLLVGDIDRGGVFAQLYGTIELLEEDERDRIKGLIINKFRGDKTILDPGITMIEEKGGISVAGVLPYIDISIEDEDSLSERFEKKKNGSIDIVVIKLPYISNFTDFNVFDEFKEVSVRYVRSVKEMGNPDMVIIPGSKSTVSDMRWLAERGFDAAIRKYAEKGGIVFGICGGFQILGEKIEDPYEVETGGETKGIGLLPVSTTLLKEKTRTQKTGKFEEITGELSALSKLDFEGYEIHMGQTKPINGEAKPFTGDETGICSGNVYGTYIHGIFDGKDIAPKLIQVLADKKGVQIETSETMDYEAFKESQYDALADMMREHMDMSYVYSIMGIKRD
ncbi:MAG: cobyric acid synthase [Butyrivibrio sp.]|nr:cobyric acid synthase [Butyrivibrio sp.]